MPFSKENIVVTFEGYEVSVNTFVEYKNLKFALFCVLFLCASKTFFKKSPNLSAGLLHSASSHRTF